MKLPCLGEIVAHPRELERLGGGCWGRQVIPSWNDPEALATHRQWEPGRLLGWFTTKHDVWVPTPRPGDEHEAERQQRQAGCKLDVGLKIQSIDDLSTGERSKGDGDIERGDEEGGRDLDGVRS